jgi:hypothetical protein
MAIDWGWVKKQAGKLETGLDLLAASLEPFADLLEAVWLEQDLNEEWILGVRIVVPGDCTLLVSGAIPGQYWKARLWSGGVELEEWLEGEEEPLFVRTTATTQQDFWAFLRQFPAGPYPLPRPQGGQNRR